MGIRAGKPSDARHRAEPHRRADRAAPAPGAAGGSGAAGSRLTACAIALLVVVLTPALAAAAERLRIATWHAPLSREGPGLLLRDIRRDDPAIARVADILVALRPDILLLTDLDWDLEGAALAAFSERLQAAGLSLPNHFAARPNSGWRTAFDLDGDGRAGRARDARGYGRFAGAGGMALFSRLPIDGAAVRDFTPLRWREFPGNLLTEEEARRGDGKGPWLSSTAHWDVPVILPGGARLHLLAFAATAPVFDGPEDFNGRRNHDEIAFWAAYLDGRLPWPAPDGPVVVLGNANLDPLDGEGLHEAIATLLAHPRLQDPRPSSRGAVLAARRQGGGNKGQRGEPALDTADLGDGEGSPGNLRLSYILPDRRLRVAGAGVFWPVKGPAEEPREKPAEEPAEGPVKGGAERKGMRHHLVWVDVELPAQAGGAAGAPASGRRVVAPGAN
ncbi:MAG: endonuclease/exonuclease/phosphatase family protein [Alphaproteobacteria bacterium]|nr:MAG: endonuclease/exonuclease/phosphatase family protein [Alphaproteobacteria bacterium]